MAGDGIDKTRVKKPINNLLKIIKPDRAELSAPDALLTGAVGRFEECMVLGWTKEGDLEAWSCGQLTSEAQMVYTMSLWKHHLMKEVLDMDTD